MSKKKQVVYIVEYHRWDESFVDSVYKTYKGAEKAMAKLSPEARRYYSVIEREVYE